MVAQAVLSVPHLLLQISFIMENYCLISNSPLVRPRASSILRCVQKPNSVKIDKNVNMSSYTKQQLRSSSDASRILIDFGKVSNLSR